MTVAEALEILKAFAEKDPELKILVQDQDLGGKYFYYEARTITQSASEQGEKGVLII